MSEHMSESAGPGVESDRNQFDHDYAVGDVVVDTQADLDDDAEDREMVIVELLDETADERTLWTEPSGRIVTVAMVNKPEWAEDEVVVCVFPNTLAYHEPEADDPVEFYRSDAFEESRTRSYDYPVSRVERVEQMGDADE